MEEVSVDEPSVSEFSMLQARQDYDWVLVEVEEKHHTPASVDEV